MQTSGPQATVDVTHAKGEAMTMGGRVAVLKDGVLQRVDTPAWLLALTAPVPGDSAMGVGERIMLRPHHEQAPVFSPTTGERLD